jgi:hypothetical protein
MLVRLMKCGNQNTCSQPYLTEEQTEGHSRCDGGMRIFLANPEIIERLEQFAQELLDRLYSPYPPLRPNSRASCSTLRWIIVGRP